MANKKNKLKKPKTRFPTPPPIANDDDEDLMNQLLNQLESQEMDQTVQAESAKVLNEMQLMEQADRLETSTKISAKYRYKARQARKAAALAETYSTDDPAVQARLEKEVKEEEDDIARITKELGVRIHEINPDGHCLFSAIAEQLYLLGILPASQNNYAVTRAAAADYMYTHPNDFVPFLPPVDDYTTSGLMTPEQYSAYCSTLRNTAYWGGEPEILALSRAFNVSIHVIQGGKPSVVVHEPPNSTAANEGRVARISYHRKMYGLGEHYNSLCPITPY